MKIQRYHVVYATITAVQKVPGLPGSKQPCKVKICNMKPPWMYTIVFLDILLTGHLQSKRFFQHCGAQYCRRCFIGGTWVSSHSGGTFLASPLAHVWMTWGLGALHRECVLCSRDTNLGASLFAFLELWNFSCLMSLMTSS